MPVWQASSPARRAYGFAISNSLCKLSSGIVRLRPHNPWVTQPYAPSYDRTASWYSAPIPSPESSTGISHYRCAGLRLHAHADQAGQG